MLNHMCWSGIAEAEQLLESFAQTPRKLEEEMLEDQNQPFQGRPVSFPAELCDTIFALVDENLTDEESLRLVQKWIQEEKLAFLLHVVNRNLPLSAVADAIRRYHYLADRDSDLESPNKRGIEVSLIRRFLSDQLDYVSVAKRFIEVSDCFELLNQMVFSPESQGKLGGKSAGMYLAAQILKKQAKENPLFENVRTPRTFFITSDVMLHFMHFNNFDEVVEQKYKPINQVRFEYPHIVQSFKNAHFPAEIENGLSKALDELGDCPLIVRSSSLLEDRIGAAFSGKYKSLFVANQGSKQQRMKALLDAIAEVYASTFGPDPIEYRAERNLLAFGEEMGLMVQEVVGTRVGQYYLPSYAGVAFSRNEFRWSPRIKRDNGLLRLVPGLGTRAVDRLSDDYPVLVAPGQPGLRVNTTPDEAARYSPNKIDVINLETNRLETHDVRLFLKEVKADLPALREIASCFRDGMIRDVPALGADNCDDVVITFDGLTKRTNFLTKAKSILEVLEKELGMPVDVEFACDGKDFYILQCRPQSFSGDSAPMPIPQNIPKENVIFTAHKYISNGQVPDITHVVYVDPLRYGELSDRATMVEVGRAIGRLNTLLPKRQFILMGPGRWGSRGDIKLGVSITYSDINNTAALIEIAKQKGNYVPDLSFGTHFFQDLVEASIRYLPLYPDEEENEFNERFLLGSTNMLGELAPEYAHLSETVRLIDVPASTSGRLLRILLNADLNQGIGMLVEPTEKQLKITSPGVPPPQRDDQYWRWRLKMVEHIASKIDADEFGVNGFYVFGSTKNATAGPASDIDVIVHITDDAAKTEKLANWLEGWSLCLAEMNYLQTGYRTDGLLDVHLVTDDDIKKKTSWAAKIGAVTDPARSLRLKSD
jgi:hypothetical protein